MRCPRIRSHGGARYACSGNAHADDLCVVCGSPFAATWDLMKLSRRDLDGKPKALRLMSGQGRKRRPIGQLQPSGMVVRHRNVLRRPPLVSVENHLNPVGRWNLHIPVRFEAPAPGRWLSAPRQAGRLTAICPLPIPRRCHAVPTTRAMRHLNRAPRWSSRCCRRPAARRIPCRQHRDKNKSPKCLAHAIHYRINVSCRADLFGYI